MKHLAAILILSFLGVAVFGFLAMNHDGEGGMEFCLATAAGKTGCPGGSALGEAVFHISVFKSFSLAVLAFLISVLAGLAFLNFLPKVFSSFFQLSHPAAAGFRETPQIKFFQRYWLSLHENSPSAF